MREAPVWTVPLGRWGEVPIRLHMSFVLMLACTLYLSWLAGQLDLVHEVWWVATSSVLVFCIAVALHVAAHLFAARRLSFPVEPMVVGPLGDLAEPSPGGTPRSKLIVSLAGSCANLFVAVTCVAVLTASGDRGILQLIVPWPPTGVVSGNPWQVMLKLTLWMNWTLAVVNLLPARPFDGGTCTLAVANLLYPKTSQRRVEMFVQRCGLFAGLALLVAAILSRDIAHDSLLPPWFALLAIGIVVVFASQQRPRRHASLGGASEEDLFGYDFSQGYTSLERSHSRVDEADDENGPLERWLEMRREARRERQLQLEAEEDERVDEILARVHQLGLDGLSQEERLLLERVSMRYRTRHDPT